MEVSSKDELTVGVSFLDLGGKNGWVVISSFPAARLQDIRNLHSCIFVKYSRAFNDKIWNFSCSLHVLNWTCFNGLFWVSYLCFSMFQPFLPNNNTNLSFRSVLRGKPMWITTQQPDHPFQPLPLKVLLGASLPDSWQGAIGCFQRSRKIQQTGRDAAGKGSNPKLLHSATWWCLWCESIAQQKCAKIQLFRMISVRIRKHDFQYSRYSHQQLTWPSVHCQTNTWPNSCAVDFSLRQVIWMPWSLASRNGPRVLLCWWHVVHLHWKWLNQRLDMHFWTHVPWCRILARFWWKIPER